MSTQDPIPPDQNPGADSAVESSSVRLGRTLQGLPKPFLYLILMLGCTIPLLFNIKIPNKPTDSTIDLYSLILSIPEGKTVLLSSDWTNGTRAESGGEMDALLKLLMSRHVKFVVFSIADPQAPQVAKDEIAKLNVERKKAGLPEYKRWEDWIDAGYFPNAEGTANALAANVKSAFAGVKDVNPDGTAEDIFDSPVLKGVSTLKDIPVFFDVTPSSTSTIYIQRISGKVPLALLVTGVMGPEAVPYYDSGQVRGLAAGLKGVYDLETMMVTGINEPATPGEQAFASSRVDGSIPGLPGTQMNGKGALYYPALHVAMGLLILAIIVGNVGMFFVKRGKTA